MVLKCELQLDSLTNPASPGLRPAGSNGLPSPTRASLSTLDGVSSSPPSAPAQSAATPLGEKGVDGILSEKERERILYPGRVTLTSESSMTFLFFPTSSPALDSTVRRLTSTVLEPVLREASDI
jgi:hypothetical protein